MALSDIFAAVFGRKRQPQRAHQPPRLRMYAAARVNRLSGTFTPANSSADAELISSLMTLRSRSRQLVRDASYAARARELVVNNVIGTGIGLQAQVTNSRGEMNKRINADIEAAFNEWCEAESCHTGGRLEFSQLERALVGEVFEAGEVFVRIHRRAFGDSSVPLGLELIESERIADQFQSPTLDVTPGNALRMGIEVDEFYRPVSYFIRKRHPEELPGIGVGTGPNMVEKVPAGDIIHLAIIDRFPQTRGAPWLHATIRRMSDMDGYTEAEITRARTQALTAGVITTPQSAAGFAGDEQPDGSFEMEMQAGTLLRLNPGEAANFGATGSPNPVFDSFMRQMIREVAIGVGVSYESLSGDYSQGNYSSSRMGLLDARDVWRHLQNWFICSFREKVHEIWLGQAVLSGAITSIPIGSYAINTEQYEAVRFKPRGWSWVDPVHEVAAYRQAVMAGFTTVSDVIAATAGGLDFDDVLTQRTNELEQLKAAGLVLDTSPEAYNIKTTPQGNTPQPAADNVPSDSNPSASSDSGRVIQLR